MDDIINLCYEIIRRYEEGEGIFEKIEELKIKTNYCSICLGRGYLVADADWEPTAVKCACKG